MPKAKKKSDAEAKARIATLFTEKEQLTETIRMKDSIIKELECKLKKFDGVDIDEFDGYVFFASEDRSKVHRPQSSTENSTIKVAKMKKTIKKLESDIKAKSNAILAQAKTIEAAVELRDALTDSNSQLTEELDSAKSQLYEKGQTIDQLTARIKSLEAEREEMSTTSLKDLQNIIEKNSTLIHEKKELANQLASAKVKIEQLTDGIKDLKEELMTTRHHLQKAELEIEAAARTRKGLDVTISQMAKKLDYKNIELTGRFKTINKLVSNVRSLEAAIASQVRKAHDMSTSHRKRNSSLATQNKYLETQLMAAKGHIAQLTNANKDVGDLNIEYLKCREELENVKISTKAELNERAETINKLIKEIETTMKKISVQNDSIDQLSETIQELEMNQPTRKKLCSEPQEKPWNRKTVVLNMLEHAVWPK